MSDKKYTIEDLKNLTGYSIRTIRYYVQEGLIEPPAGRGRGGFYYDSQLNKLLQIRSLQEKGMGLFAIREHLKEGKEEIPKYTRDVWIRYEVMPGFEINIRRDIEEKEGKKIFDIVKIAKSIMKKGEDNG